MLSAGRGQQVAAANVALGAFAVSGFLICPVYVEIHIAPTNGPLEMMCSERVGFVLLASLSTKCFGF